MIFTIGAYDFTEEKFFSALIKNKIEIFIDVRWRRGMRGAKYKFLNAQYLQYKMRQQGIGYHHFKALAPPPEMRAIQKKSDKDNQTSKRKRTELSEEFVQAYHCQIVQKVNLWEMFKIFQPDKKNIVLHCVERCPEACHRSILSHRLGEIFATEVRDILP